jgi:hypothetical protein
MLELVGATYIHPEDSALTERSVVQFKEAGFRVNAWTVNRADVFHFLVCRDSAGQQIWDVGYHSIDSPIEQLVRTAH